MLSRKKRHQTPTFLEGTQGRYVQRESPPRVPTCHGKGPFLPRIPDVRVPEPVDAAPHPPTLTSSASFAGPSTNMFTHVRDALPLSSQSFTDGRHKAITPNVRKHLTSSVSIGDVVYPEEFEYPSRPPQHRNFSTSLQTLPGYRPPGKSIIDPDGLASDDTPEEELPLPPHWDVKVTPDNIRYYVDHNTQRTHWLHPLKHEKLPPGWKKRFSEQEGVTYYNEYENRTQIEHPGLATDGAAFRRAPTAGMMAAHSESTIEDLNIINETDIPEWLSLYARSDTTHDHMLDWSLFPLNNLEQSDLCMRKLFKQEVIDMVIRYERYKRALQREINRRIQPPLPPPPNNNMYANNNVRRPPGL